MTEGLLWAAEDSKESLEETVLAAARRYHERYHHWPDACKVRSNGGEEPETMTLTVGVQFEIRLRMFYVNNLPARHVLIGTYYSMELPG